MPAILDRFRAFTVRRQVALVATAFVTISVVLVGAWYFLLHTGYRPLFTDLRAADASVIVTELERRKIPYRVADGGKTVLVPEDRVDTTRLSVMSEDLPLHGTVGFELFNKSDLGLTDFAQKINYQRALQGELARTIMALDGVEATRVHIAMGEDRLFREDRVPPKASVTIRMRNGADLPERTALGIQRLIAAAVPKLDAMNVVILDETGKAVVAAQADAPAVAAIPGDLAPRAQEMHAIAEFYTARIRAALLSSYPMTAFDVSTIAPDAAGTVAVDWTPASRVFPLTVRLASSVPLDATQQTGIRDLVVSAIGSPVSGDVIAVGASPVFQNAPQPMPVQSARHAAPEPIQTADAHEYPSTDVIVPFAVLIVLGVAFALVVRSARRPRRLSEAERTKLVARLRAALDQGGEHAAI